MQHHGPLLTAFWLLGLLHGTASYPFRNNTDNERILASSPYLSCNSQLPEELYFLPREGVTREVKCKSAFLLAATSGKGTPQVLSGQSKELKMPCQGTSYIRVEDLPTCTYSPCSLNTGNCSQPLVDYLSVDQIGTEMSSIGIVEGVHGVEAQGNYQHSLPLSLTTFVDGTVTATFHTSSNATLLLSNLVAYQVLYHSNLEYRYRSNMIQQCLIESRCGKGLRSLVENTEMNPSAWSINEYSLPGGFVERFWTSPPFIAHTSSSGKLQFTFNGTAAPRFGSEFYVIGTVRTEQGDETTTFRAKVNVHGHSPKLPPDTTATLIIVVAVFSTTVVGVLVTIIFMVYRGRRREESVSLSRSGSSRKSSFKSMGTASFASMTKGSFNTNDSFGFGRK